MALAAMNQVLVLATYLDDELLGCGGTFARHADAGGHVQVLVGVEGATSRQQQRDCIQASEDLSALAQAAQMAGSMFGLAAGELLDLPGNPLDCQDPLDLIKRIEERAHQSRHASTCVRALCM